MNLISVNLHGYKRFANRSSMNVDGKLIAIVGPNESGKSSFLEALTQLNHGNPLTTSGGSQETTRNKLVSEDQDVVEATYLLDDADREALSNIHGGKEARLFTLAKRTGGKFYCNIKPRPRRSLQPRKRTVSSLSEIPSRRGFLKLAETLEEVDLSSQVKDLVSALDTESQTIDTDSLQKVESLAETLELAVSDDDPKYLRETTRKLYELVDYEKGDPFKQAINILVSRRPKFLLFADEERLLESEYNLEQVWEDPPAALRNLARVAELDLQVLHNAIQTSDTAQVATIRERANARLRQVFADAWFQSEIAVGFDTDGLILRVFVTEEQTQYTNIAERSDGLRQFVALLAFATLKHSQEEPILLIDEAETHLHYDAQADLVQMLTRQEIVSKVIYTTHSIGCLPEDLGTGVRLIGVDGDNVGTSTIRNWFWESDRPGFSPLLFGMGARTLAFIPIRNAVVAEGIVDSILWPTLLREATERSHLDFQVVPGISEASLPQIKQLDHEAPCTAYLFDSDKGGEDLRKQLKGAGIPEGRIFSIPDGHKQGLAVEDLVDAEVFLEAVNEELRRHNSVDASFPKSKLPTAGRVQAIKTWCESKGLNPPSKRSVAYRVIERRTHCSILSSQYYKPLRNLFQDVTAALKDSKSSS